MRIRRHSDALMLDLYATVKQALCRDGVVNVPAIAFEMNDRYPAEATSLSELEAQVLAAALQLKAIVLFQRPALRGRETECPASR